MKRIAIVEFGLSSEEYNRVACAENDRFRHRAGFIRSSRAKAARRFESATIL